MTENKRKGNEIKLLFTSLRHSFALLGKNDPMRMAGATAFFTTFALPPIVFILSQLFGLFIGRGNMGRGLIENISNTLGKEGAEQVRQVVRLSLIHISEPTRQAEISYAVFCLK